MNKDLKMLLITLGLFFAGVVWMYVAQHLSCNVIEYQDLKGTHTENVCTWEK
jgi:hypothetical protein